MEEKTEQVFPKVVLGCGTEFRIRATLVHSYFGTHRELALHSRFSAYASLASMNVPFHPFAPVTLPPARPS